MDAQSETKRRSLRMPVWLLTLCGTALLAAAVVRGFSPGAAQPPLIVRCLTEGVTQQAGYEVVRAAPHRECTFTYEITNHSTDVIQIGAPELFCQCALDATPDGELRSGETRTLRFRFDAPPAGFRRETVRIPTSSGPIVVRSAIQTDVVPPALVLVPDTVSMTVVRGVPAEQMFLLSSIEQDGAEPVYAPVLEPVLARLTLEVDAGDVGPAHQPGCIARTYRCTLRYDGGANLESGEVMSLIRFPNAPALSSESSLHLIVREPIATSPEAIRIGSLTPGQRVTLTFLLRDLERAPLDIQSVDHAQGRVEVHIEGVDAALIRFSLASNDPHALPSELRFETNHPLQPEITVPLLR